MSKDVQDVCSPHGMDIDSTAWGESINFKTYSYLAALIVFVFEVWFYRRRVSKPMTYAPPLHSVSNVGWQYS